MRCTWCSCFIYFYFSTPFIILPLPRTLALLLLPSSNSDPGPHSGPFSPLPTTVHSSIFIARRLEHFLPSSTRVELYLPEVLPFYHLHRYSRVLPSLLILVTDTSSTSYSPSIAFEIPGMATYHPLNHVR